MKYSVLIDYFDSINIPGGMGSRQVINDPIVLQWVGEINKITEITVSICSGSRILAKLGLLDNLEFTTHHEVYDHMKTLAPKALPRPA